MMNMKTIAATYGKIQRIKNFVVLKEFSIWDECYRKPCLFQEGDILIVRNTEPFATQSRHEVGIQKQSDSNNSPSCSLIRFTEALKDGEITPQDSAQDFSELIAMLRPKL